MTLPSNSLARRQPDSLADVLERVLDKGIVIAGDIVVNVLDIELLSLKLRLFIASAETAREMGMDWWTRDPFFNSQAEQSPPDHQVEDKRPASVQTADGSPAEVTADEDQHPDAARLAEENAQLREALQELRDGGGGAASGGGK